MTTEEPEAVIRHALQSLGLIDIPGCEEEAEVALRALDTQLRVYREALERIEKKTNEPQRYANAMYDIRTIARQALSTDEQETG